MKIENQTASPIVISDLGFTIAENAVYNLSGTDVGAISRSNDLLAVISNETVKLIISDQFLPYTYRSTVDAIRKITDPNSTFIVSTTGNVNVDIPGLKSEIGNKLWVHSSSKPQLSGKQFYTVWCGASDDLENGIIGGGMPTRLQTTIDQPVSNIDIDFVPDQGDVYMHQMSMFWSGPQFGDTISIMIKSHPTLLQQFVNLDLTVSNNRISYVGPGLGTHGFAANPILIKNTSLTGHWNYNTTDGLVPVIDNSGGFDIYDIELNINRFMHQIPVMGISNGFEALASDDTARIPPGYFIRLTAYNASNTVWKFGGYFNVYRESTFTI